VRLRAAGSDPKSREDRLALLLTRGIERTFGETCRRVKVIGRLPRTPQARAHQLRPLNTSFTESII
jgi:hypothetical protein